ncbi:hypothetical protein [Bacillus cereus]|nr:hypothetical protein [Bacillus cereus]
MGNAELPASINVPKVHINSVINMYELADMTLVYRFPTEDSFLKNVKV